MAKNNMLRIMLVAVVLALAFALWPDMAAAQQQSQICPEFPGYSGKIVNCVKTTLIAASSSFLAAVYDFFRPMILVTVVIAVTLYGLMIVSGQLRSPLRDTFVLLFKIIAVLVVTQNFANIYAGAIAVSEDALTIVSEATANSTAIACGGDARDIWKRVDCAVEKIIGIGLDGNTMLVGGITGMITAFLFSASWGIFIALLAVGLVLLLVMTVAEAVYIYLNAFIALACMAMLAPMFIPMVLFTYTRGMFDRWLKMTLSFILQPMFLFAYLSLMLAAFDTTVLFGQNSLYAAITGAPATNENYTIGDYFTNNGLYEKAAYYPLCIDTDPVQMNPAQIAQQPSKTFGPLLNYVGNTSTQALCDLSSSFGIGFDYTGINLVKWGNLHNPPLNKQQLFKKMLIAFAMATLVAYVMHATMGYIPMMGSEVAGGLLDGVNLSRVGRMPGLPGGKK